MAKMLQCGKNKIAEAVPVHGFGIGRTKAKAMSVAKDLAHGFANAVAAERAVGLKCPTEECPKMIGPQVANEKTTELLTVKLQNNLYLSVVRRGFDIVIFASKASTSTRRSTALALHLAEILLTDLQRHHGVNFPCRVPTGSSPPRSG
jgi:hypothetical protein